MSLTSYYLNIWALIILLIIIIILILILILITTVLTKTEFQKLKRTKEMVTNRWKSKKETRTWIFRTVVLDHGIGLDYMFTEFVP